MKKALNIFFLLLSLSAFKNIAYAETPIDACWNFNKAGDYKRAIEAGKLAVKEYPKSFEAYRCLGEAYSWDKQDKLAYENLKKAESLTNNKKDLMNIYNEIGWSLIGMKNFDLALSYFKKALNLAKDLGDTSMQDYTITQIAYTYELKGELDKALSYYKESLKFCDDEMSKLSAYNSIAMIYDKKGDYQKAIEYYQKILEIHQKHGYDNLAFVDKLNLGETYREMKDYKNAEKYLFEGLEGVKKFMDTSSEAGGYFYLGRLYRDKGDKEKAREYYKRSYDLYKSINFTKAAQEVLNEMKELDK